MPFPADYGTGRALTREEYDRLTRDEILQHQQTMGGRSGTANASPVAPAYTEQQQWARAQIKRLFQHYQKRDPTEAEYRQWQDQGPNGINALTNQFDRAAAAKTSQSTSTTTPAAGSSGGLTYEGNDPVAWIRRVTAGMPPTTENLIKIYDALKAGGVSVSRPTHAGGVLSDDKLVIDGQMYDFIRDVGGSKAAWSYGKAGGGAGTSGPQASAAGANAFKYPAFKPPSFDVPDFVPPGAFTYDPYQPLTAETFEADPGYEFARGEGFRGIQNAAASQGMLRSKNTLTDLMRYGTGLASQEFGNVDARNFRNWQAGRSGAADLYDRNWQNALTTHLLGYNKEADEYNRALSTYGTNFGTAATSAGINLDQSNSRFGNLLSLYDLATRNLPRAPTPTNPAAFGYTA